MADKTSIEWTRGADGSPGATWNPITGCSVVSPGCTNCYAMKLAGTRLRSLPSRRGLTVETKAGPVWNGEVRLNEEWLMQPLRWRRPRKIFVCAHGDLFAENVPDEWIDRVFAVMALAPQHTFQVLTKRATRMRAYLTRGPSGGKQDVRNHIAWVEAPAILNRVAPAWGKEPADGPWRSQGVQACTVWPLPNVWLGVSAEDQRRADERVPDLLATPAAVRFVSAEPLLGPITFSDWWLAKPTQCESCDGDGLGGRSLRWCPNGACPHDGDVPRLDWIIVGGESGPGARPMHPAWARQIRDACTEAGAAYLFKQWGSWAPEARGGEWMILDSGGGLDLPDHRWPDEEAGEVAVTRTGKKAAGRLLDGVTHDGFPEARA